MGSTNQHLKIKAPSRKKTYVTFHHRLGCNNATSLLVRSIALIQRRRTATWKVTRLATVRRTIGFRAMSSRWRRRICVPTSRLFTLRTSHLLSLRAAANYKPHILSKSFLLFFLILPPPFFFALSSHSLHTYPLLSFHIPPLPATFLIHSQSFNHSGNAGKCQQDTLRTRGSHCHLPTKQSQVGKRSHRVFKPGCEPRRTNLCWVSSAFPHTTGALGGGEKNARAYHYSWSTHLLSGHH